jgi:hypothetical protein
MPLSTNFFYFFVFQVFCNLHSLCTILCCIKNKIHKILFIEKLVKPINRKKIKFPLNNITYIISG